MSEREPKIEYDLSSKPVDIIWTLDKVCHWDCAFCCVDAYEVKELNGNISIKSNGFTFSSPSKSEQNSYKQAENILIAQGLALSLEDKLVILNNLSGLKNPKIDFSGGDILLIDDNIQVIKTASQLFGKENISLTATGIGIRNGKISECIDDIGELEFTYDGIGINDINHRQLGYNKINLEAVKLFRGKAKTRALIPISRDNSNIDIIHKLYSDLNIAGIDSILLMRTFPVGRGKTLLSPNTLLDRDEYLQTINEYFRLEQTYKGPKVKLQCALKNLYPGLSNNPCGFLDSSLGISSTGYLTASPWAYDQMGGIINPELVLGDLRNTNIETLYSQKRVKEWLPRLDENFGHCKVMSMISDQDNNIEAIFSKTDPLYSE